MSNLPGVNFMLGEDIEMLRDSIAHFAREGNRAARGRDRPHRPVPDGPLAQVRRAGRARDDGGRGVRRRESRLHRAHGRDGGDLARVGVGRAVVRRAFEPVREPDPPQRHRCPEAQVSAEADFRRAHRRARDERAERGLRRRRHEAARGAARRALRAQRHEDVDHERPGLRHARRLREDRARGRRAGSPRSSSRRG